MYTSYTTKQKRQYNYNLIEKICFIMYKTFLYKPCDIVLLSEYSMVAFHHENKNQTCNQLYKPTDVVSIDLPTRNSITKRKGYHFHWFFITLRTCDSI